MNLKFTPGAVSGAVTAPPSKSYSHRALILASLADGESTLTNFLVADDTRYTLDVLDVLGVSHRLDGNTLRVTGSDGRFQTPPGQHRVYVGNSGSTVRMAGPLAALTQGSLVFDGESALHRRPVSDLLQALKVLGIEARSLNRDGNPPIEIQGGLLRGGSVVVGGQISSQHISGLLMVSPYAQRNVHIKVRGGLLSKPYVDITIDAMRAFGGEVGNYNYEQFVVTAGQTYRAREYNVEGDYSSAAFCFALGAIGGQPVTVRGLNPESRQGDRYFLEILKRMGADVRASNDTVTVSRRQPLKGITLDMGNYPDIVQPLAVVAACARGETRINNIGHLIYKETDRINNTSAELLKMGVKLEATEDTLTITGGKPLGAEVDSHRDHRMAMSLAVLALFAEGSTVISGVEAVSKSYHGFLAVLLAKRTGLKMIEVTAFGSACAAAVRARWAGCWRPNLRSISSTWTRRSRAAPGRPSRRSWPPPAGRDSVTSRARPRAASRNVIVW